VKREDFPKASGKRKKIKPYIKLLSLQKFVCQSRFQIFSLRISMLWFCWWCACAKLLETFFFLNNNFSEFKKILLHTLAKQAFLSNLQAPDAPRSHSHS